MTAGQSNPWRDLNANEVEWLPWPRIRYAFFAYFFPWATPYGIHLAVRGNEAAELLSFMLWPFLLLFVGMYIGTLRVPIVPREIEEPFKQRINSALGPFHSWYTVAIFLLALFEFTAAIGLQVKEFDPWQVYLVLSISLFLPYVLLMRHGESRLAHAEILLAERPDGKLSLKDDAVYPTVHLSGRLAETSDQ